MARYDFEGSIYAGLSAAGHNDGGVAERGDAVLGELPYGAAFGAAFPFIMGGGLRKPYNSGERLFFPTHCTLIPAAHPWRATPLNGAL